MSFTAIAQVVEYVVVLATLRWGGNVALALLGACALGALMGSVNGFIIHYFRVTTIIVTMATLNLYYRVAIRVQRRERDLRRASDVQAVRLLPPLSKARG